MKRLFLSTMIFGVVAASCGGGASEGESNAEGTEQVQDQASEAEEPAAEEAVAVEEVAVTIKSVGETMTTMAYEPKQFSVPAGAEVTLTLENTATAEAMIHNVVIIKAGQQEAIANAALAAGPDAQYLPDASMYVAATSLAQPGETVEVKFTAPTERGTYQYICTYPGHLAMKGLMVVK